MATEDLFRILNMSLIVVWFYFMWKLHPWWASRPKEERMLLVCMPLLLLITLFSSGESLAQNVGFGARVLLLTPVLSLLIFSTFKLSRKINKNLKIMREEDKHD